MVGVYWMLRAESGVLDEMKANHNGDILDQMDRRRHSRG